MRLLVTIPHFYGRTPGTVAQYGSELEGAALRRQQVERCLVALHQTFGRRQALQGEPPIRANATLDTQLDVVLVTSGDQHLVADLPPLLFTHASSTAEPRHLGFACHDLMREQVGRYDYYAYLEDDIEILDPLFFNKLGWFSLQFGHSALLQPNRYEIASGLEVMKLYVDGPTTYPEIPALYQDVLARPKLMAEAFGRSFLFERMDNVHAGCFFLNAPQLARIASSPKFGRPTSEFFGPLESAATLMIMRTFEVYKPARENAAFLELHHLGRRFLVAKTDSAAQSVAAASF